MSVCFFVPADQAGTSAVAEETIESDAVVEEMCPIDNFQVQLQQFWTKVMDDIRKVNADDFKTQALPLARIKKIMKLDDEVKMISAEAPVLFAKAAEIFIYELTMRAWSHTEDNKRRTLQRNDIAMAISKSDQFDFLIDIVPRHEVKPTTKPKDDPLRTTPTTDQYYLQLAQQHQAALQGLAGVAGGAGGPAGGAAGGAGGPAGGAGTQLVVQPCAQLVQQTSATPAASTSANVAVPPHPVTLVQHLVGPASEMQQLPIHLTQAQLNMIRLQIQNNPTQPIIIQTAQPQTQSPQIIQVTSQSQHQPQHQQVFLAQVATSQEES